jgi:anti-sigma factor RsiW
VVEPTNPPRRAWNSITKRSILLTALALTVLSFAGTLWWQGSRVSDALVKEAVNDHLRFLYAEHAIELPSNDLQQVKPWFTGRVDFAPVLEFSGDAELPLVGGSIAYFVDRKAAAFLFKQQTHGVTLLVFRASGLPWALRGDTSLGRINASRAVERGFSVLLWRDADLGYALISDLGEAELARLGAKIIEPAKVEEKKEEKK